MILFEALQKIDFTEVGSTNLLPLDIGNAIIKDKLSVLIFSSLLSGAKADQDFSYSEFHHPKTIRLEDPSGNCILSYFIQRNEKKIEVRDVSDLRRARMNRCMEDTST